MPIDKRFIINLNGKDYPQYGGILGAAHEAGLSSIETTLLQIPTEENGNTAVVKAVVRMKDGTFFEDYGDASPKNTSARVATALIRMASTRSKGRALRDAINCGETMLEELPPEHDDAPKSNGHATPHAAARARETAAFSTPGYEDTYTSPGVRHYTRAELIKGTQKRLEQAKALGIQVPEHKPELMANKALFGLAEKLTEEIKAAKAAAAGAEGS